MNEYGCLLLSFVMMPSILYHHNSVSGAAACSFYHICAQPPTSLDCNPYFYSYDVSRQPYLSIPCVVRRMSDNAGSFDVHWFKRSPNDVIEDLGRVQTIHESSDLISINLTFYNMVCTNFVVAGDYWCQVINMTAQPHTYLGMSNVLRIGYPNQYNPQSLKSCKGGRRETTTTCADIPADQSLESTISSSKELNPTLSFTSSTDTAGTTGSYSLPVVGKSVDLEVQAMKPTLTDIQTHSKSTLGNKYVMVVSNTPCFAKETISVADNPTPSETTIPMSTSVSLFVSTSITASQNSNDAASFTTSESNRDLLMSHLVYPIIISILVLVIVILSAIVSIQCCRKKGTRSDHTEEQLPEPQPYMEPIRTLPRENNSVGSEQGTTSLTAESVLWMNNLTKDTNPLNSLSLNKKQDHEMLSVYESLNTSTLEPQKDYTMVNKLSLKSNEPPGLTF